MQILIDAVGLFMYVNTGTVSIDELEENLMSSIFSKGHKMTRARVVNEAVDVEIEFKGSSRLMSVKEGATFRVSDVIGDEDLSVIHDDEARAVCNLILSIKDKEGG